MKPAPLKLVGLLGLALIVDGTTTAPASALEWRFCIAPAGQDHRIYMTPPFPTTTPMEVMESDFQPSTWQACWQHVACNKPAATVARAWHDCQGGLPRQGAGPAAPS